MGDTDEGTSGRKGADPQEGEGSNHCAFEAFAAAAGEARKRLEARGVAMDSLLQSLQRKESRNKVVHADY